MAYEVLDRSVDLKTLEAGIKNKFKWAWFEETDKNSDFLSEYIRKIYIPVSFIVNGAVTSCGMVQRGKVTLKIMQPCL
jgi:hypothetical protein